MDRDVLQQLLILCPARNEDELSFLYAGALPDEALGELFEIRRPLSSSRRPAPQLGGAAGALVAVDSGVRASPQPPIHITAATAHDISSSLRSIGSIECSLSKRQKSSRSTAVLCDSGAKVKCRRDTSISVDHSHRIAPTASSRVAARAGI